MEIILLMTGGAVLVGCLLILLAALTAKKNVAAVPVEKQKIAFDRFERICCNLLYELKLEIDEIRNQGLRDLHIVARNPAPITGGTILVQCQLIDEAEIIPTPVIIEFSNLIVQERCSKGIFITTGRFTEDLASISELAPIEFIDGDRLNALVEQYHL